MAYVLGALATSEHETFRRHTARGAGAGAHLASRKGRKSLGLGPRKLPHGIRSCSGGFPTHGGGAPLVV